MRSYKTFLEAHGDYRRSINVFQKKVFHETVLRLFHKISINFSMEALEVLLSEVLEVLLTVILEGILSKVLKCILSDVLEVFFL